MADFTDIVEEVASQIKRLTIDRVSVELMHDLKRNGKTFRRALSAIALLGVEMPAVDLAPIRAGDPNFSVEATTTSNAGTIVTYEIDFAKKPPFPPKAKGGDDEEDEDDADEKEMKGKKKKDDEMFSASLVRALEAEIDRQANGDSGKRADILKRMASAAGISVSTVQQILRNEIETPPEQRLRGFARTLGLSFDRLAKAAGLEKKGDDKMTEEQKAMKAKLDEALAAKDAAEARVAELESGSPVTESTEYKQMAADLAAMKEKARKDQIASLTASCKIPAFREEIEALGHFATSDVTVVKFSQGEETVELDHVATLEQHVSKVNELADRYFSEVSEVINDGRPQDKPETQEEADNEVEKLISTHLKENDGATYAEAMSAVLADPENKELAELYAQ